MSQIDLNLPPITDGGAAVITGAAGGIGLAAARRFAELGMSVVLADLSGEKLRAAETSIREAGGRVAAVPTDVSKPADLARLRDLTQDQFGHVGVLMLNAGVGANPGSAWQNLDAWRSLIDVNLWGVINGAQAFVPAMVASGRPACLFVDATNPISTRCYARIGYMVIAAHASAYRVTDKGPS